MRIGYGKTSGCAVAAMSALAERHEEGVAITAAAIARSRRFSKPLVAKVLNALSSAGFVVGARGPGGGFRLARPPEEISILEIVMLFEGKVSEMDCPFGRGYCGNHAPCPMHDILLAHRGRHLAEMRSWNLGMFRGVRPARPVRRA